jgi:hypothetical protein
LSWRHRRVARSRPAISPDRIFPHRQPGAIYAIDKATGPLTPIADIAFSGAPSSGPGVALEELTARDAACFWCLQSAEISRAFIVQGAGALELWLTDICQNEL